MRRIGIRLADWAPPCMPTDAIPAKWLPKASVHQLTSLVFDPADSFEQCFSRSFVHTARPSFPTTELALDLGLRAQGSVNRGFGTGLMAQVVALPTAKRAVVQIQSDGPVLATGAQAPSPTPQQTTAMPRRPTSTRSA